MPTIPSAELKPVLSISRLSGSYLLGLCLFGLAWLVPDHYQPWASFHSEAIAFLGLFGLLVSVLLSAGKIIRVPIPGLWISLTLFLPWAQFASGIIIFSGDAVLTTLYLAGLLAAVVVGFSFGKGYCKSDQRVLNGLMHVIWIVALISACIGIVQWFNQEEMLGPLSLVIVPSRIGERAMGNLAQSNHLATLLLAGMIALLFVCQAKLIGYGGLLAGMFMMTIALVLTQSRTGLVGAFAACGFLIWKNKTAALPVSNRVLVCWSLCFVSLTMVLPSLSAAMAIGGAREVQSIDTIAIRWTIWKQVGHAIVVSPWTGFGWNQTPLAQSAGVIAVPGEVTYTNAHNVILDILAWNGLPLGLLLTSLIAYWLVTRSLACQQLAAVYAMACLISVTVHSLLEYPFAYSYFLILVGFMAGIVESTTAGAKSLAVNVRWVWSSASLCLLVGVAVAWDYFYIEEDYRAVRLVTASIGRKPDAYDPPKLLITSHMEALLKSSRVRIGPKMDRTEINLLKMVSERFSYSTLDCRYAMALAFNGEISAAKRQMDIVQGKYGEKVSGNCRRTLQAGLDAASF